MTKSYYQVKPQKNHQSNQTQIEKVSKTNSHIIKQKQKEFQEKKDNIEVHQVIVIYTQTKIQKEQYTD